jgi:hypothetical protein
MSVHGQGWPYPSAFLHMLHFIAFAREETSSSPHHQNRFRVLTLCSFTRAFDESSTGAAPRWPVPQLLHAALVVVCVRVCVLLVIFACAGLGCDLWCGCEQCELCGCVQCEM